MEVGVRELKQHLSAYLARASRGEFIQVTDRGVPKAVLGPVPGQVQLEEGLSAGWVTPGEETPLRPVRRAKSRKRIADVLSEDRGA